MKEITGYTAEWSVEPGQTIPFMVSTYGPDEYRADIVRLISGDATPQGPGIKEEEIGATVDGTYLGRRQEIYSGSYVQIPDDRQLAFDTSFSLWALVYPTLPSDGTQTLLSKWSSDSDQGYSLSISSNGVLALTLGDSEGTVLECQSETELEDNRWYFVATSVDLRDETITLSQHPVQATKDRNFYPPENVETTFDGPFEIDHIGTPDEPFMIGAAAKSLDDGRAVGVDCYTGKIETPQVSDAPADPADMKAALGDRERGQDQSLVASWDFAEQITDDGMEPYDEVTDETSNDLHGTVVNCPTRGVTGHNWSGETHQFTERPAHYAAIHFHHDDLADAEWGVDFEWEVPSEQESAVYAARLQTQNDETHIPFFVRPKQGDTTAQVAFLAPTNSYLAYANDHVVTDGGAAELIIGRTPSMQPADVFLSDHREYGLSCYDTHADGHGVMYSSRLRPILNLSPKYKHWLSAPPSAAWQFNADLHLIDWLEEKGFGYDVVTDEDLHEEGVDLVDEYDVVLTGTHPEYYSTEMWDGLFEYQQNGGRLMYMGANGFYWQTAFHPDNSKVVEVRKGESGTRTYELPAGEESLSFTGEKGGLWRQRGKPPQKLAGVGFSAQGFDACTYYRRRPDSHEPEVSFIFDGVDEEILGDFGLIGGGAAGLEVDRYDSALGTPENAYLLAASEDHTDSYLHVIEEIITTTPTNRASEDPQVRADMVYYKTPEEGAVFSTGSIAWCGSLAHDDYENNVSRITENVLTAFMNEEELPGEF